MLTPSEIRQLLDEDQNRVNKLISDADQLAERYRNLMQDPQTNAVALRELQAEITEYRARGTAILKVVDALAETIDALPPSPEKTALKKERSSFLNFTDNWVSSVFIPFRDEVKRTIDSLGLPSAVPPTSVKAEATPVSGSFSAIQDPQGEWGVWDDNTGRFVETGLGEEQALDRAAELTISGFNTTPNVSASSINVGPAPVPGSFSAIQDPQGEWGVWDDTTGRFVVTGLDEEQALDRAAELTISGFSSTPNPNTGQGAAIDAAAAEQATKAAAKAQQSIREQRKQINQGDWRVRLRLAPNSKYLYNAGDPGILAPLKVTDGVIFPYTPRIDTSYRADYDPVALTHSNYRGYFYKSSYVDFVQITTSFTAQDTSEANYLLAVIHFFKSATKMFYGQDAERGAPPPLVYLSGLGDYQFAEHPCVISQFNYNLPSDVDYIRAGSSNINGTNLQNRRPRQDLPSNPISSATRRLETLGQPVKPGAEPSPPAAPTLGLNNPTYVPTKLDISITLLPMQSRSQVSKQFSLKQFANGQLLKGGFW